MRHKLNILIFSAAIVFICLFLSEDKHFILYLILAGVIFSIFVISGVLFMNLNYFLRSISKLGSNKCLLTFDDGPDEARTPMVLDILKRNQVKALFFLIGEKAQKQPALVQRIINDGHLIGNHSQTHNNFMSMFGNNKLKSEILAGQNTLHELTGNKIELFRPPIGYTNPKYARVLKELNLKCIGWTLRSYDSVFKSPQKLLKRLNKKVKHGSIVLLHDNLEVSVNALEDFIIQSKSNGIIFASSSDITTILDE